MQRRDLVHPNDLGTNRIADILVQIVGKLRFG
jgi:lysophospholipase L1-like esterase